MKLKLHLPKLKNRKKFFIFGPYVVILLVVFSSLVILSQSSHERAATISNQTSNKQVGSEDAPKPATTQSLPTTTPAPSTTTTQATTPKNQTPVTTSPKPKPQGHPMGSSTPSQLTIGPLIIGAPSAVNGICSIPVSTTIRGSFTGSFTIYFSARITGTGKTDTFAQQATVSPNTDVLVSRSLTFIEPYTYDLEISMYPGPISLSSSYQYPTITYTGSKNGIATCNNY